MWSLNLIANNCYETIWESKLIAINSYWVSQSTYFFFFKCLSTCVAYLIRTILRERTINVLLLPWLMMQITAVWCMCIYASLFARFSSSSKKAIWDLENFWTRDECLGCSDGIILFIFGVSVGKLLDFYFSFY